ncbi:MAG: hypothetical protein V5A84_05225 [Planctomycetota bacterium]
MGRTMDSPPINASTEDRSHNQAGELTDRTRPVAISEVVWMGV